MKYLNTKETATEYISRLKKLGYKIIGKGLYGVVFDFDENRVVKIAKQDCGYDAWVEYAMQNQENKFMPKIYDHRRFIPKNNERFYYSVTILEKLDKTGITEKDRINFFKDFTFRHFNEKVKLIQNNKKLKKLISKSKNKKFKQALNIFVDNKNYEIDLHEDNIMLRKKQIVITDAAIPMG